LEVLVMHALGNGQIAAMPGDVREELPGMTHATVGNRMLDALPRRDYELRAIGQLPRGTSPIVFLKGAKTSFLTNLEASGNFTLATGALSPASSNPP
jgi:hypothetical protein